MTIDTLFRPRVLTALGLAVFCCSVEPALGQDGVEGTAQRAATARVRPGDRIDLHFPRERDLSGSIAVNERGEAAFPKIGIVDVAQMTIAELRDTLGTRYGEFLRVPDLQVAVLRRVVVVGEVRAPNVYMVDVASSVAEVIARAGGLTEMGNRNRVVIVRNGERIPVKEWDLLQGPAMDLQSGDQVIVGRKSWFTVNALTLTSTAILVASFIISVSR